MPLTQAWMAISAAGCDCQVALAVRHRIVLTFRGRRSSCSRWRYSARPCPRPAGREASSTSMSGPAGQPFGRRVSATSAGPKYGHTLCVGSAAHPLSGSQESTRIEGRERS